MPMPMNLALQRRMLARAMGMEGDGLPDDANGAMGGGRLPTTVAPPVATPAPTVPPPPPPWMGDATPPGGFGRELTPPAMTPPATPAPQAPQQPGMMGRRRPRTGNAAPMSMFAGNAMRGMIR